MRIDLKLNITRKGLVLISIPFVFEIAFVAVLFWVVNETERNVKMAERGRNYAATCTELGSILLDEGKALFFFRNVQPDQKLIAAFDRKIIQAQKAREKLKKLSIGDARREQQTALLCKGCDELDVELGHMRAWVVDHAGPYSEIPTPVGWARFGKAFLKFKGSLDEITEREKSEAEALPDADAQGRVFIRNVLLGGLLGNIALTVWLLNVFSKDFAQRIQILSDNAVRLAKRQRLNPPVRGADELAKLDETFHQVAGDLQRAEQMKQEFVQMISHDLRTPLTSLQTTLALAANGTYGELSERGALRISQSEESVQRLIELINQLLDLEKIESGNLQLDVGPVPVSRILERALASCQGYADKQNVVLVSSADSELPNLIGDEVRLVQVLVNLIGNAIKFSPVGGKVTVSADAHGSDAVRISVCDQGPGIQSDQLVAVFDRFQQVGPSRGGTGLGLAICKAIVEAHGGRMNVVSEVGEGSTFSLTVPAESQPAPMLSADLSQV